MNLSKVDKRYVSDVDKFLEKFDNEHPQKSASQQAEIDKAAKISAARDTVSDEDDNKDLWEGF